MTADTSSNSPRVAEAHEFIPEDYFARVSHADIFPGAGRETPLEIDLGCGDGSFLLAMARHAPGTHFLCVERLLGRVRKVSRRAEKQSLENVKVLRLESRYTVEWLLEPGSVRRLHLLCPDPWPKARHHRRRIIQPEFLQAVHRVLEPDGEFLFMTDHPEYYEWTKDMVAGHGALFRRETWDEDTFYYPQTDFQIQWEAEGKSMHRLRLRKIG